MSTATVEPERIQALNERSPREDGRYVLYWMQASQRAEHNPALELAVQRANEHRIPVVVLAVIDPDYPAASARAHSFFLGGLARTMRAIERRGLRPCIRVGDPAGSALELSADAAEVVTDRGYLRHQVDWRSRLAADADCAVTQVEGDVVVPAEVASDSHEVAARTFRRKVNEHRDRFVADLATTAADVTTAPDGTRSDVALDELDDVPAVLERLGIGGGPPPVGWITPGTAAARFALDRFLDGAAEYDDRRNRYNDDEGTSRLSPYLHFGQISPVAVVHRVVERLGREAAEPFLEELVVRRELAVNHVLHCPDYDRYAGLPEWARTSLADHADDEREHVYTSTELEAGETHDELWNTIMNEIRERGWVHNQLRMYWGKQFVRWTNTPSHAFRTLLEVNNRWFLDGRDPSSYANVGWCFGLHDQGFKDRSISGKLRPFTTAALERKDDLAAWVDRTRGSR